MDLVIDQTKLEFVALTLILRAVFHTNILANFTYHYNLPLTFKGNDFEEGDAIYSPKGKIDIESMVKKGT